jgi:hypothetical protein
VLVEPLDKAEALLRRAPGLAVEPVGLVVGDPCDEVVQLGPARPERRPRDRRCGESRRLGAVAAAGFLVADLALRGSDHVPLVQDDEADVIQDRRIGSKSEIQLLRCGDDNLAGAKRVLVDVADPHAAVERRDADAERREGLCEDLLRLSGQGSEAAPVACVATHVDLSERVGLG